MAESTLVPEVPRNYVLVGRKSVAVYLTYVASVIPEFEEVVIHAKGKNRVAKATDLVVQAMKVLNLKFVSGTVIFPMNSTKPVPTLSITLKSINLRGDS